MRIPPPLIEIKTDEEHDRAQVRIAELGDAQNGSVEEAERVGLLNSVRSFKNQAIEEVDLEGRRSGSTGGWIVVVLLFGIAFVIATGLWHVL